MKAAFHAVVAAMILAGCVGTPHHDASEVSALEVAIYKKGMDMGCRDAGRGRGDSASNIDSFCSCLLATLDESLSDGDWKRATYFAQQRRDRDEQSVIAPYLPQIAKCRVAK